MEEIDQWTEKFLRETPFMAFGSLLNAYGRINAGKHLDIETIKRDTTELFKLAMELTRQSIQETEKDKEKIKRENDNEPLYEPQN